MTTAHHYPTTTQNPFRCSNPTTHPRAHRLFIHPPSSYCSLLSLHLRTFTNTSFPSIYIVTITHRPQFFFRTADVTGTCHLQQGVEMVTPGENTTLDIELIHAVPMADGLRFALREGGKTVGAGVVAKVLE